MKNKLKLLNPRIICFMVAIISCPYIFAQDGFSFFNLDNPSSGSGAESDSVEIEADSADIDVIKNNKVTLKGNVVIKRGDVTISSDQTELFLENKPQSRKTSSKTKGKSSKSAAQTPENKGVNRIVFLGNFKFIQKCKDKDGKPMPSRKAFSGKAVYDAKTGTITLTKDPVISQGKHKMTSRNALTIKNVWLFKNK